VEALLAAARSVVGVDCFTDYYSRELKEANLAGLRDVDGFEFVEGDLAVAPLDALLDRVDAVFHLAAQPGVRSSFGSGYADYLRHNVNATQRLLDAAAATGVGVFVYASSSSVYGDQVVYPVAEDAPLRPLSPYASTKVITEQLASAMWRSCGLPVVGLRYFTVYGPRQRPDMAFSRFLTQALADEPITIFGNGRQVREFTFIDDVVQATIAAGETGTPGTVYNVGGGEATSVLDVVARLEGVLDRQVALNRQPAGRGDPQRTQADIRLARRELGYCPSTPLTEGLTAQAEAAIRQEVAVA
jgi:nucleoside-diphosphate-sugar epimerase